MKKLILPRMKKKRVLAHVQTKEDIFSEPILEEEPAQPFVNDLDAEINRTVEDDSSVSALQEIMRGPTAISLDLDETVTPQRQHSVMKGTSPKFFFIMKKHKKKAKVKRELIPVNEAILELAEKVKKPFIRILSTNLDKVRSFVIFKLAPTTLPLVSALDEAKDVLKEIVSDDVQSSIYSIMLRLATTGTEIKAASFMSKYLKLTQKEEARFYERVESDRKHQKDVSELQKVRSLQSAVERTEATMRQLSGLARKGKVKGI